MTLVLQVLKKRGETTRLPASMPAVISPVLGNCQLLYDGLRDGNDNNSRAHAYSTQLKCHVVTSIVDGTKDDAQRACSDPPSFEISVSGLVLSVKFVYRT